MLMGACDLYISDYNYTDGQSNSENDQEYVKIVLRTVYRVYQNKQITD